MRFFRWSAFAIVLTGLSPVPVMASDDPAIPSSCRDPNAADSSPKCSAAIESAYVARTRRHDREDAVANAALKAAILTSTTYTGETVQQVLDVWQKRTVLGPQNWVFAYSRGGNEYVVMSYGRRTELPAPMAEEIHRIGNLYDDDNTADEARSIASSLAPGYVAWKIVNGKPVPWGHYADMLQLGSGAFTWAINGGEDGIGDSGFDLAIRDDLSFLRTLKVGSTTLAAYVPPDKTSHLLIITVDGSYRVEADGLACPATRAGMFTIEATDCAERETAAKPVSGTVLPFKVIRAVRNAAFKDGMVDGFAAVSVRGGSPADWLATAVFVAEHAMVGDVTFTEAEVYAENPWFDRPPTRVKELAKAFYAPDPSRSPWTDRWLIVGAEHAPSAADIEYDEMGNDLMPDPDRVPDPEKRNQMADAAARARVLHDFHLPPGWQPSENLGMDGTGHDRDAIMISVADPASVDEAVSVMQACLQRVYGEGLKGCLPPTD